jgi:disulfide bond formation protein DsbB
VKYLQRISVLGYILIALLFFVCGFTLIVLAAMEIWSAVMGESVKSVQQQFQFILECVGLLTISVAAFELGQTVLEEEVQREVHVSSPTRLRRFLSRFLIVVVVSLGVECLVGVFQFLHTKPELLPQVASIGIAAAVLLASWGIFVRLNVEAEKLEPEAMHQAQEEDKHVET